MDDKGRLESIHLYPVKSLSAVNLETAHIESRGVSGDRRWIIVDPFGEMITQRAFPQLAQVKAFLLEAGVRIAIPGGTEIDVSFPSDESDRILTRIWQDRLALLDAGNDIAAPLSDFLGEPVRLAFQSDRMVRPVDPRYRSSETDQVSLADGYPLLVASHSSLVNLNSKLTTSVAMDRFRANLVVSGFDAFDEDAWRTIQIGTLVLDVAKPCARCSVINVNQQTGKISKETLTVLSSYRRNEKGKVLFGQNLIPRGEGVLSIGDAVVVLEKT